jgi:hypothetical protein
MIALAIHWYVPTEHERHPPAEQGIERGEMLVGIDASPGFSPAC